METMAPVDVRTLLPLLTAGSPAADAARATRELTAVAQTPEGALEVMRALLEWAGRADAAAECANEAPDTRRGEAMSLLAWALADQRHDSEAEQVGKVAIELGLRRAATDALLLVWERQGRHAERDELVSKYLASEDAEGFHALVPMQRAALEAWDGGDLLRATNLSRAIVERSPADMAALFRAGYGLYLAGRWADAVELLERYRKWTEDDDDALLPLAGCLYGLGRYDDAMTLLGRLAQDAQTEPERLFLAWVQIAWNELGKGLLERAEGAVGSARAVLEQRGAVDEAMVGLARGDLDAIEGVIDALSGQLDLAHRTLARMRRSGAGSAAILEEAIADVEAGRVRTTGIELPRHRRQRPRGSLADKLQGAQPGQTVDLDNGAWDAEGVVVPPGVVLRGQGPDTILQGARSPILVSRGAGAAIERLSVVLSGKEVSDDQAAILIEDGDLCVRDVIVEATRGVAVAVRLDAKPLLERVELRGGLGLGVYDRAAPVVRGGRITGGSKRFGVLVGGQATGEWREVEIAQTDWACVRVIGTAAPSFLGCKVHGSKNGSGFWIGEDARGLYEGNEIFGNRYPGILCDERSKPVARANRVHHHACAAIQLAGQSEATIENNEVQDVDAAHIECLHESKGTVRGNVLRGGAGPGVWVLHGAAPTIEDDRIEGTRRSGIEVAYSARPIVKKCVIERSQGAGVRITEGAAATVEDTRIAECVSGIDVSGNATPVLRANRAERCAFAGLVLGGGARVQVQGLTIMGGKVGIDLGGRAVVEASGLRIEGVEATPVQAGGAARGDFVGAVIEPPGTAGPTLAIAGGAEVSLRDATVRAAGDAPAIVVRGQGVLRVDGGTVQGSRSPVIVAADLARVRVRAAALVAPGGPAIDAGDRSAVALEDVRAEGEPVRFGPQAEREAWAEPPLVADAHASVVLLCRTAADDAAIARALGADGGSEGTVRFSIGRTPPPRAALWPLVGEDSALEAAVREAGAWVEVHRKTTVPEGTEVAAARVFAQAVLRVAGVTGATAIWAPRGARLALSSFWTPERVEGPELGRLFCSVRGVPVGTSVVVETVGLDVLGQTDVQCESAADHRAILEPILWAFVDAMVAEPHRYGYRGVTRPVAGSPQTFMLQEGKHDFAPARRVWSLQPIGDLAAGGGWSKQAKQGWGKPAAPKGWAKS